MLSLGLIGEAAELTPREEAPTRKPQILGNWQGDDQRAAARAVVDDGAQVGRSLNQAVRRQPRRTKESNLQDHEYYEEVS